MVIWRSLVILQTYFTFLSNNVNKAKLFSRHTMVACQMKFKSKLCLKIKFHMLILSLSLHFLIGILEHLFIAIMHVLILEGIISGDALE